MTLTTYSEVCTEQPSHYTLEFRVRNRPLEDALAERRDTCPVCGADLKIEEET